MMQHERRTPFDQRTQAALDELQGLIAQRYPLATFEVAYATDEPDNIHLTAIVDVDDTDTVLDLIIDRVVELQVEARIPVHVIPIRTPERVLAAMQAQAETGRHRPARTVPLVGTAPRASG